MDIRRRTLTFVAASWIFILVWLVHRPVDSVLLRHGNALPLAAVSLVLLAITLAASPPRWAIGTFKQGMDIRDRQWWIECLPWMIALWTGLSVWVNRRISEDSGAFVGHHDESMAHWLWLVTTACVWTSVRRALAGGSTSRIDDGDAANGDSPGDDRVVEQIDATGSSRRFGVVLSLVLIAGGMSLSIRAIDQQWITIPQMIAEYEADPDAVVLAAGLNAPPGSSQRMMFENRLRDGGASASFALANSLAAVLVICFALATVLIVGRSPIAGTIATIIIGIGLWTTNSRSGVAASMVCVLMIIAARMGRWIVGGVDSGPAALAARCSPNSQPSQPAPGDDPADWKTTAPVQWSVRRRFAGWAIIVGLVAPLVAVLAVLLWGNGQSEWFAMAPASFRTRIDYWQATIAMSLENPWFGIGPGNFQAAYPMYRLPHTSENIADPHHFWFETLAIGGIPAALMLAVWIGLLVRSSIGALGRQNPPAAWRQSHQDDENDSALFCWFALGGVVSVCVYEFAIFQLRGATLIADAVAIVWVAAMVRFGNLRAFGDWLFASLAIAIVGIGLHLSFSGGWSVPGIAIAIWLILGTLCPAPPVWSDDSIASRRAKGWRLAAPVTFLILALLVYFVFHSPRRQSQILLEQASSRAQQGDRTAAERLVTEALRANRFNVDAAMLSAAMASQRGLDRGHRDWQQWVSVVRRFGGTSANQERQFLDQAITAYQRSGQNRWLESAVELAQRLRRLGPVDVSHLSASAVVHAAAGQIDIARQDAASASRLASLTPNPERSLERQMCYLPLAGDRLDQFVKRYDADRTAGGFAVMGNAVDQFEFFGL